MKVQAIHWGKSIDAKNLGQFDSRLPLQSAGLYKVSEQVSGARRHQPHFVGREGKGKRKKKIGEKRDRE